MRWRCIGLPWLFRQSQGIVLGQPAATKRLRIRLARGCASCATGGPPGNWWPSGTGPARPCGCGFTCQHMTPPIIFLTQLRLILSSLIRPHPVDWPEGAAADRGGPSALLDSNCVSVRQGADRGCFWGPGPDRRSTHSSGSGTDRNSNGCPKPPVPHRYTRGNRHSADCDRWSTEPSPSCVCHR